MKKLILSIFLFSVSFTAFSQTTVAVYSASQIGLSGSNGANLTGWESILINPAGLENRQWYSTDLTLFSSGGGLISNTGMSFEFYNTYFTGTGKNRKDGTPEPTFLNESDKKDLINTFDPELKGISKGQIIPFAFSYSHSRYGTIGFMIVSGGIGYFSFPKSFAEIAFSKLNAPGLTYDLSDLTINGLARNQIILSYAYSSSFGGFIPLLDNLAFGISAKIQQGLAYTEIYNRSDIISTDSEGVITRRFKYDGKVAGNNFFTSKIQKGIDIPGYFFDPAGSGMGYDFSISGTWGGQIKTYVGVTDFGSIDWSRNAFTLDDEGTITLEPYDVNDKSKSQSSYLDSLKNLVEPNKTYQSFTTDLPTALNAGISLPLSALPIPKYYPGDIFLYSSFHLALNEAVGNQNKFRSAFGAEWIAADMWIFRSGFSYAELDGFNWGIGAGFKTTVFQADIGTSHLGELFKGESAQSFSISGNLRWFIPFNNEW